MQTGTITSLINCYHDYRYFPRGQPDTNEYDDDEDADTGQSAMGGWPCGVLPDCPADQAVVHRDAAAGPATADVADEDDFVTPPSAAAGSISLCSNVPSPVTSALLVGTSLCFARRALWTTFLHFFPKAMRVSYTFCVFSLVTLQLISTGFYSERWDYIYCKYPKFTPNLSSETKKLSWYSLWPKWYKLFIACFQPFGGGEWSIIKDHINLGT